MKGMQKKDIKILLVNPRCGRQLIFNQFPLGLGYISQALINEGYPNIQVRDFNVHNFEREEFREFLNKERFNIVGLTGLVTVYPEIKSLSQVIKETLPETCVILGGGVATAFPEIVLKNAGVDIVVLGEGERTVSDLFNVIFNGGDLESVHGICFLSPDKNMYTTPRRDFIKDLDSILFPNRELFPTEDYLIASSFRTFQKKSRIVKMYTSRGCPYSCGYCFHDIWGRHYRHRSPENVVEEIKLLKDRYGITGINFIDDVFTINKKHTINLCEELLRKAVKIDWLCSTRVNLVDDELLKIMKRAGCRTVCYGIESGNQRVLNEMKKGVTVEQAAVALEKTWKAGIVPYSFFMIGYFGESEESIRDTINFCIQHGLSGSFSFPTPFPGTDLFIRTKNEGLLHHSEEWILEHYKEWAKELNINLTDIPDERLKKLKFDAEIEISRKVFLPNIIRYFKVLKLVEFFNYCSFRLFEYFRPS